MRMKKILLRMHSLTHTHTHTHKHTRVDTRTHTHTVPKGKAAACQFQEWTESHQGGLWSDTLFPGFYFLENKSQQKRILNVKMALLAAALQLSRINVYWLLSFFSNYEFYSRCQTATVPLTNLLQKGLFPEVTIQHVVSCVGSCLK